MTSLKLERDGNLVSIAEIQGAAGTMDRGVDRNLSFRRIKDGPASIAMGVEIQPGTGPAGTKTGTPGGVSYPWTPGSLPEKVDAACLSYSVFLPADFEFARGGVLPGLFGLKRGEHVSNIAADRFETLPQWAENGRIQQYMVLSTKTNTLDTTVPAPRFTLPRGRWVKIEQEIVLNAPGDDNGIIRLWVDGVMRLEGRDALLRRFPDVHVAGVQAETYFGGAYVEGVAKKKEQIWLTPFDLRWN